MPSDNLLSSATRRIREKRDRSLQSLRDVLGAGEPVALGGEEWLLYPLQTHEVLDMMVWREKHPMPKLADGLTVGGLDRLTHMKPGEIEQSDMPAAEVSALLQFNDWITRWNAEHALYVVWLSMRRNGLTDYEYEQCLACGIWPLTEQDISLMLSIKQAFDFVGRIFRLNGAGSYGPSFQISTAGGNELGRSVLPGDGQDAHFHAAVPIDDPKATRDPDQAME